MTYFRDFTRYGYVDGSPRIVTVGWLVRRRGYTTGETSEEFRRRLTLFCENPPRRYVSDGFHACEFCGRVLGGSEIRVLAGTDTFAAPVLIHHYVATHGYRPPDKFIEAVMAAPLPGTPEFHSLFGDVTPQTFPVHATDLRPSWNKDRKKWWQFWK